MASHHYYFHCLRRSGGIAYDGMTMTPPTRSAWFISLENSTHFIEFIDSFTFFVPFRGESPAERGGRKTRKTRLHPRMLPARHVN